MTATYSDLELLAALLADVESDLVKRKAAFDGDAPRAVRQTICAFANAAPPECGRTGRATCRRRPDTRRRPRGRLPPLRILPAMDRSVFLAHIRRTRFAPGNREKAQADAHRIADFLRVEGATRVVGIGSAFAPNRRFTKRSDIDLVVEGLPPRHFLRASARAADMTTFELDLTPAESATDYMRQAVDDEGVDL